MVDAQTARGYASVVLTGGRTGTAVLEHLNRNGARYAVELARPDPIIFYAASREWADKNAAAIKKFRDALTESAEIVNNDREKASTSISKFTKQPIELVKATPPNRSEPVLKPEQLAWWIEVMSTQKMLQSKLDTSKLVLK